MRLLGVVLAGGASRRMGEAKALMAWASGHNGRHTALGGDPGTVSLYEHAALRLEPHCGEVVIAAGGSTEVRASCGPAREVVDDLIPDAGPLSALAGALRRAHDGGLDAILALACDMPLVAATELEALVAALEGGADAALWQTLGPAGDRQDHPLVAAYRCRLLGSARAALDRGQRRVVAMFDAVASQGSPIVVERLVADENSALRLVNVNTRTDYDRARRRAESGGLAGHSARSPDVRTRPEAPPGAGSPPGRTPFP